MCEDKKDQVYRGMLKVGRWFTWGRKETPGHSWLGSGRWKVRTTHTLLRSGQEQKPIMAETFVGRTHCHVAMVILPPAQRLPLSPTKLSFQNQRGESGGEKLELLKPSREEFYWEKPPFCCVHAYTCVSVCGYVCTHAHWGRKDKSTFFSTLGYSKTIALTNSL